MNTSEQINELAAALAKAQAAIQPAKKDRENPAFKGSKYADLASVWDACREPLTANGLSVVQMPIDTAELDRVAVTTILLHSSGQWIGSTVSARVVKNDPQGVGSTITYLRRYALSAMTGVAPDDDDGNAGSGQGLRTEPARYSPPMQPQSTPSDEPATEPQIKAIYAIAKDLGWGKQTLAGALLEHVNVPAVDALTKPQAKTMIDLLKQWREEIAQTKQPALSDEWAEIEQADTARKDGATKAIAR